MKNSLFTLGCFYSTIEPSEQIIKVYDTTAIVSVLLKIKGDFLVIYPKANIGLHGYGNRTQLHGRLFAAHSTMANS